MHFAMIHGGLHGAWCWDLLQPELARLGHEMTAVDLPCEDVSLGAAEQAHFAVEAFKSLPEDLVLVSHSIGGLVGALVPALRPVRVAIFLCAALPDVGRSFLDQMATEGLSRVDTLGGAQVDALGRTYYSAAVARELLYGDCSPDVSDWAFRRLRHQSTRVLTETTPLTSWARVAHEYIYTSDDRQLDPTWVWRTVPKRLGCQPLELPGGHSPFLSRPRLLAETLSRVVAK